MKKRIRLLEVPHVVLEMTEIYSGSKNKLVDTLTECWLKAVARDEDGNMYGAYWRAVDEDEAVTMFECGLTAADIIVRYDEEGRAFDVTWGTQIWASEELEEKICGCDLDISFDW